MKIAIAFLVLTFACFVYQSISNRFLLDSKEIDMRSARESINFAYKQLETIDSLGRLEPAPKEQGRFILLHNDMVKMHLRSALESLGNKPN
jgi:hypothetical protein